MMEERVEEKLFVKMIQVYRRRLNIAGLFEKLVLALRVGAVIGIFFQVVSFVLPLYYAGLYAGLALVFAAAAAVVTAFVKRMNMEQTALVMDSFGFEERIVTAYGNLGEEGMIVALQRADAMKQLQAQQDKIQIALLPPWKKTAALAGVLVILLILGLLPAEMKERAEEYHSVREETREKTDEIEEMAEALEQLIQEEELTPEQKTLLQEMIESLQASQEEYQQITSAEMMKAASEKLAYRYENAGGQLASLAQSLQNGTAVSPVTVESMHALAKKMQEMGGAQFAIQDMDSQSGASRGDGQGSQGQNGQPGNQDINGQSGNSDGNGQGGQNGDASQPGVQGNNSGSDGIGDMDGNGQDSDTGSGRGTGTNNTPHDYVSIPNDIADSGNLVGNAVDHDVSEYFQAQNGLSWEGEHISYEEVIGSYEQNAYEGIAAGKYPSGMEKIIKAYFSSFN